MEINFYNKNKNRPKANITKLNINKFRNIVHN